MVIALLLFLFTCGMSSTHQHLHLCRAIADRIANHADQRIPFTDYMDLALYHPDYGYYATNQAQIGVGGDFFTSPHLGKDFGELLAEQLVDMWQVMGQPQPFSLVEMGAGQGLLAVDILRYLNERHPEFFACIDYVIIEKAAGLIADQQRRLKRLIDQGFPIRWTDWQALPSNSIVGCCFSNELVDAFPVHLVTIKQGELQEIYVTLVDLEADIPQFIEIVGELSTPKLREYFELVGVQIPTERYPEGFRSEVNLAALDWIETVCDRIQQGYLLTIDYGYPADRYYSPYRDQGTLQCYYQHSHHDDPYIYVGQQDITAHVDFTALENQGERCGLYTVGTTQQAMFLMALGLGDRIANLSNMDETDTYSLRELLRRRQALHDLMNPMGLGNFGVLVQSKGLSAAQQQQALKGLTIPPLM
ncbi:MAG: class I SAM-dependent methyltransferase [Thainema sp.]